MLLFIYGRKLQNYPCGSCFRTQGIILFFLTKKVTEFILWGQYLKLYFLFLLNVMCFRSVFSKDELNLEIAKIAVPAALGLMADPIASLIDTAFIGHLG